MGSQGGGCGGASNSNTSSGGSGCSMEEPLKQVMDQRKRKRTLSNRDSARRSRQRKQKHLDDLMNQLSQLGKENERIHATYNMTIQQCQVVEADNCVLRTQMMELNSRFHALDEILDYVNSTGYNNNNNIDNSDIGYASDLFPQQQQQQQQQPMDMINSWNPLSANNYFMASEEDLFLC